MLADGETATWWDLGAPTWYKKEFFLNKITGVSLKPSALLI
jgi:hypothetical protein